MTTATSSAISATASTLFGVWVHDPTDPSGTIRAFPHAGSRSEPRSVAAEKLIVHGRRRPIAEFGEHDDDGLAVTLFVPFGGDHADGVQFWRDALTNRRVICYRDNRSRVVFGVLLDGIEPSDERAGTSIAVKLTEVDYTPGT